MEHLITIGLTLVNAVFTLISVKLYTDYTKDRLMRRRRSGEPKAEG
jgi:hypothetical protein